MGMMDDCGAGTAALSLLAAGSPAEVNRANYAGELPLHAAAENGHSAALAVLVGHQAWLDRPSAATGKTALFAAADACSAGSVEVLADAILRTHSFIAMWVLRQPWADRSAEPARSWSALQLCEARGAEWLPVVQLLRAAEASGTVGAQQRLAWARVGEQFFSPADSASVGVAEANETPSLAVLATRRREERLRQQKQQQQPQGRPLSTALVGVIGRVIGLQPSCSVAARCLAQQCAAAESRHESKPTDAAGTSSQLPAVPLKQLSGSMESLSAMAQQRTAAPGALAGSGK